MFFLLHFNVFLIDAFITSFCLFVRGYNNDLDLQQVQYFDNFHREKFNYTYEVLPSVYPAYCCHYQRNCCCCCYCCYYYCQCVYAFLIYPVFLLQQ
ncbi:hypothetical protein PUN28_018209 [Cardiocondyla obscurior]|uniref:Secreted protein n=1 Tax=Cardiocondyla obscurior TaxID=286306 RepID=A0AAW2EGC0_9HYME